MPENRTESELRDALREICHDFNIGASTDWVIGQWREAGLLDHITT